MRRFVLTLALVLAVVAKASALPPPLQVPGAVVGFASSSPFTLEDAMGEPPPIDAVGALFLPPDADGGESGRELAAVGVPAVVLLHGAGGVSRSRELTYARQFAARGWAALVVDAFGARVEPGTGFTERLLDVTEAMFLADAYAGLRFLAAHPAVDPSRVAIVGFSYGGMVSTYALHDQVRAIYAEADERFVAHAAYYAPCIARFENVQTTGAPYLMLYGTGDAIVDPLRCDAVLGDLRQGGSAVALEVYEGAAHRWDSGSRNWQAPRGLAGCRFRVAPDGVVRDERTFLTLDGYLARTLALGWCADSEGYLIRGDAAVKRRSDIALERFLADAFTVSDG